MGSQLRAACARNGIHIVRRIPGEDHLPAVSLNFLQQSNRGGPDRIHSRHQNLPIPARAKNQLLLLHTSVSRQQPLVSVIELNASAGQAVK